MRPLFLQLATRVLPAILTALGILLLTAGLATYAQPPTGGALPVQPPVRETLPPAAPTATPLPTPVVTPDPDATPTLPPEERPRSFATRIVIPDLWIDLPVMRGPPGYPPCNVAMYMKELAQPGEGRGIYIHAHARDGMFLPILEASKINNGRPMLGMVVQVYTSDDLVFRYEIFEVRRHQTTLLDALAATEEQLWLQTSEGPRGTPGKTQVIARPLSVSPADPSTSQPKPRPRVCG
jgi:hypothetical protein